MKLEKAAWEIKNEKNKASVRWLLVFVIGGYFGYLISQPESVRGPFLNWFYVGAVTAFVAIVNLAVTLLILEGGKTGQFYPFVKYATMLADLAAISLALVFTGGSESMFFPVYFVVIVSNSLRYGMRLAITGVAAFNVMYVLVLVHQYYPHMNIPGFQKELLKVGGFWLIGLYTGYLSRRFEMLQGEVEKYERLLKETVGQKSS
jgi:hypothetical protein